MKNNLTPRKVIVPLLIICFLFLNPPCMLIYNQPVLVFGMPMFVFGMVFFGLLMLVLLFLLYKLEYPDKKEESPKIEEVKKDDN